MIPLLCKSRIFINEYFSPFLLVIYHFNLGGSTPRSSDDTGYYLFLRIVIHASKKKNITRTFPRSSMLINALHRVFTVFSLNSA